MTQANNSVLTCSLQSGVSQSVKNPVTEFFKQTVRNSGIKLASNDDPNILTQEQALVVRDIDKLLEENRSDDCIDKFLKGFKLLIKKEKYLRKALLPTQFRKAGSGNSPESDVNIQQESLFRIFLKVNNLQKEVIEILLDEITSSVTEESQDTSWLRLLLSQLRYLPHIKNAETLTTKLLDIMEIAPYPSQLEILDSIPEVLPDSEYNETAKQLSKMLDNNEELSSAIIDCLNALNLDPEIRAQVQDHILSKVLIGTSIKTFPVFLEFLMTDYKAQNLSATLMKIRNALDTIMASTDKKNKEKESGKIMIFQRLQSLSSTVKTVSESWLNVISSIKVHTDHKPVDLLVLFMLHSSAKLKKRPIEVTFRKRVKEGTFKCSLLEQFFEKYLPQQLLRDYFTSMVEMGSSLLRTSSDVLVVDFASTLFRLLFNYEHTDTIYRQEMLDNLILLAGSTDQKNTTPILNIFVSLLEDITKIQHHTVLLMRFLEKLDTFELKDVKLVFEILCTLTCSDESLSGLKEEIHMIVRKQLSSSKRSLKHRGIVSAVVMAKHVATTTAERSEVEFSDSLASISNLQGDAKEAAAILELTKTSTADNPELLGLYYDQLASMLMKSENLDPHLSAWLHATITEDFQRVFVTETVCADINDLQFSVQYNLNSNVEVDAPLALNIAELTLKSEKSEILILPPHFRLLRLLHFRHENGDLSSIDALLGCGVVLPKMEQRTSLDSDQLKQMVDCIFHSINWFREVVSAFVTQKSKKLRMKVIQRLDNLIELEKLLHECLESIPQYKLPVSYFDVLSQISSRSSSPQKEQTKPKPLKKKLKTREIIEDSTVATTSAAKAPKRASEERSIKFREMDTDIVRLLKYPLVMEEAPPSSEQAYLNINQLNFILGDFVSKLTMLTKGRDLGLSHLNVVAPLSLISDCVMILPNINRHFVAITSQINQSDDAVVKDEIQVGFGLVLESLSLIFSWSGFQHSKRLDLLRNILKAFRPQSSSPLNSVNRLVADLTDRLTNHVDYCLRLSHAVNLIKIMVALHSITPSQEIRTKIAKASGKLLNKRWRGGDSIKNNLANIDILIKSYLSSANIKTICGLVGTLQEQTGELKSKSDTLPMLQSIDKANFYIFYRNLLGCLHDRIKTEIQSLTNSQHLTLWRTTALTMQGLMMVVKVQESKSNLVCFLKKSIAILKIFLSHGIPILEIMLKSKPDQVVEIFKTIQSNTRFLHHLCCYSKLTKSTSLMAYVPQFRLTLETLVYRVKAALVANGCSEAFWMGNLKNRDLQGEDILSQSTVNTTANEEDEEMPDDDDSCEDEEDEGVDKSGSEVFD
ncbi:Fanconi anemia group D2 protein [Asbolus verrucosus]|uniref:Fanconi anemia group D2 protein n=1 Tax=Asbolus verrucosus TaxID=1661398 RepID=A0A482VN22_ASBVE|nr:Fanconi anemia group D2 protein [Asbolus verrucosus]